jgi:hypothetical protein
MAIDVNEDVKEISKKITTYQQYKGFKENYNLLKTTGTTMFQANKKKIVDQLDKYNRQKRKQDNTCTPFLEHLIQQLQKLKGSGLDTDKFVKKIYLDSLKDTKKGIIELLVALTKEFLNCGENQAYNFNTSFYIPVAQIDLFGVLQTSPTDKIGKFFYEQKPENFQLYSSNPTKEPFSMNRELYKRTQNLNQSFSSTAGGNYIGTSLQNLLDITYVESYSDPITFQPIQGNFFKIDLKPRQTFPTIDEFLNDYYSSINVLEFKTLFTYLVDLSTGAISFAQNEGKSKLASLQKVMAINRRISCLCSDTKKEISVNSNAKISEIDNTTDSFFELTDVELRIIEQNISNIKKGVIEFEDCDNVQVPLNVDATLVALDNLTYNEDTNNQNEIEDALNILYPTSDQTFKPSLNKEFLKQFLNAMAASILSPKTILPFLTMAYATNQPIPAGVNGIEKFSRDYRSFYIKFISGLLSILTEKVFKELTKLILRLISFITSDIAQEKRQKKMKMILSIIALIGGTRNSILDAGECKSCIDELFKLLNLAINVTMAKLSSINPGGEIPLPLLLASRALAGYSPTRAFMNTMSNLEDIGVPVGDMPDGSPNKFVASIYAMLIAQDEEKAENGKVAAGVPALTVLPTGLTIPATSYGKSY